MWNSKAASLLLLFAPAAVLLILFNYIPIGGILIAFKNFSPYKGILASPWVGFETSRSSSGTPSSGAW